MANGCDEKGQCFVGADERGDWRSLHLGSRLRPCRVRRERANVDEEIERRLKDVHHVTKIMVGDKAIVCSTACDKEANELV